MGAKKQLAPEVKEGTTATDFRRDVILVAIFIVACIIVDFLWLMILPGIMLVATVTSRVMTVNAIRAREKRELEGPG